MPSDLQRAQLYANPNLSRFDPLERILLYDDFDRGLQGWTSLIGNYEHTLDSILPEYRDMRPPMLSNLTSWDTGTAGSISGTYAMKLATRAAGGSMAFGIKRITFRHAGPIRLEAYFTFKPEASELRLSETDVRAWASCTISRTATASPVNGSVLCRIYAISMRWMEKPRDAGSSSRDGRLCTTSATAARQSPTSISLADNWEDVPDGDQLLCYNEIATKQNWHYLRLDFDLSDMSYLGLRCNDRDYDVSSVQPMTMPADWPTCWRMLNLAFWVETDCAQPAFLYVDAVVLSASM